MLPPVHDALCRTIIGVKLNWPSASRQITATEPSCCHYDSCVKSAGGIATWNSFGEGAESLTIGDRATIFQHDPEFGALAGMFYIDQQTIDF